MGFRHGGAWGGSTWGGGGWGGGFGHAHGGVVHSGSLLRRIRPNFKNRRAGSRGTIIGILMIVGGLILFMSPAFFPMQYDEWGFLVPPPEAFILTIIGFFMFPAGGIVIAVSQMGRFKDRKILTLIQEIEANERVSIQNLSINFTIGTAGTIMLVRRLIETQNLQGYEVIGEVGVARITAQARPQDFTNQGMGVAGGGTMAQPVGQPVVQPQPQRRTHCAGCSAPIRENTGRFCQHCGTKVN